MAEGRENDGCGPGDTDGAVDQEIVALAQSCREFQNPLDRGTLGRIVPTENGEDVVEKTEPEFGSREDRAHPQAGFGVFGLVSVPQGNDMGNALVGEVGQFANPADGDFQTIDAGGFDAHWLILATG